MSQTAHRQIRDLLDASRTAFLATADDSSARALTPAHANQPPQSVELIGESLAVAIHQ